MLKNEAVGRKLVAESDEQEECVGKACTKDQIAYGRRRSMGE